METSTVFFSKPETNAEREEFYHRLKKKDAAPLWQVLGDLVLQQPRPGCIPALWRYEEMRPYVMESGELITADEAERRVLMIANPGGCSGFRRSRRACMRVCNWCFPERSRRLIGIPPRPCVSLSKGPAATRRLMERKSRCTPVILFLRRPGPGTIMAI